VSHPGKIRKLYSIAVRELDEKTHLGHPGVERMCDVADRILLAQDSQNCRCLQNRQ